jgi:hypothetical protein
MARRGSSSYSSLVFAFFLLATACEPKEKATTATLDFQHFTIDIPITWQPLGIREGAGTYVGYILMDGGDSVIFDQGWYPGAPEEELKYTIRKKDVFVRNEKTSTREQIYWDYYGPADTVDVENLRIHKTSWITVDNRRAKVIRPKQTGRGITGIYIDSISVSGNDIDQFRMSGLNLDSANQRKLLKAFGTLKFKDVDESIQGQ